MDTLCWDCPRGTTNRIGCRKRCCMDILDYEKEKKRQELEAIRKALAPRTMNRKARRAAAAKQRRS